MNPLVSVIIPTFNRSDIIEETLQSILRQTYTNLEIIVVSDGSTDKTIDVVTNIKDERLHFVDNKENSGRPAVVRNIGMKQAKGKYIAFCDDDDLWEKNKLEKQIPFLEATPTLLAVSSNTRYFPNIKQNAFFLLKNKKLSYEWQLNNFNSIATSSVVMRRSVMDKIGFFDEDIALRAAEDYDYWLRILNYQDQSILVMKDILINYRKHDSNISNPEQNFEKMLQKLILIYEKHLPNSRRRIDFINNHKKRLMTLRILGDALTTKTVSPITLLLKRSDIDYKIRAKLIFRHYMKEVYYYLFDNSSLGKYTTTKIS